MSVHKPNTVDLWCRALYHCHVTTLYYIWSPWQLSRGLYFRKLWKETVQHSIGGAFNKQKTNLFGRHSSFTNASDFSHLHSTVKRQKRRKHTRVWNIIPADKIQKKLAPIHTSTFSKVFVSPVHSRNEPFSKRCVYKSPTLKPVLEDSVFIGVLMWKRIKK